MLDQFFSHRQALRTQAGRVSPPQVQHEQTRRGQHDEWRAKKALRIAFWWMNYYLEWVQRSFVHFFGTLTLAILCFTTAFHTLEPSSTWEKALHHTVSAMHTVGLPAPAETEEVSLIIYDTKFAILSGEQYQHGRQFLGYAAALYGMINFGIFVSMLYSRISRK